jgi:hypothetical protein
LAVSARAGAFFIFPMLVIWAGWVFREEKKFSLKMAAYTLMIVLIGYLMINSIYSQLLGIPRGSAFGNFSYALYGQVRGGTGWYSAITDLGTRNPAIVYRAALNFFLDHPISLFIGFVKSYRDFFLPGDPGIFPFTGQGGPVWANLVLWLGTLTLLVLGLFQLLRTIRLDHSSLLLAGFTGILLSIPFLPPIDGGARFHAGTIPFFWVLPAIGISRFSKEARDIIVTSDDLQGDLVVSRYCSMSVIVLMVIAPLVVFSLGHKPVYALPVCPPEQESFVIEFHPGSYIDLINNGSAECGLIPEVCMNDFKENNTIRQVDDYYQALLWLADQDDANDRIISAVDWLGNQAHYFFISQDKMPAHVSAGVISGCAVEIKTQYQSIYEVKSILTKAK